MYTCTHSFYLQLPYYIDGDVKITQSNAILRYIGRKHNLCKWLTLPAPDNVRCSIALNKRRKKGNAVFSVSSYCAYVLNVIGQSQIGSPSYFRWWDRSWACACRHHGEPGHGFPQRSGQAFLQRQRLCMYTYSFRVSGGKCNVMVLRAR